ncbi:hypothetical protein C8Q76DRAFT_701624 [Earliella scabrosa]|nr:hypothetical protein C8Q76DRAFT_701624 [Earliella scabrosa]
MTPLTGLTSFVLANSLEQSRSTPKWSTGELLSFLASCPALCELYLQAISSVYRVPPPGSSLSYVSATLPRLRKLSITEPGRRFYKAGDLCARPDAVNYVRFLRNFLPHLVIPLTCAVRLHGLCTLEVLPCLRRLPHVQRSGVIGSLRIVYSCEDIDIHGVQGEDRTISLYAVTGKGTTDNPAGRGVQFTLRIDVYQHDRRALNIPMLGERDFASHLQELLTTFPLFATVTHLWVPCWFYEPVLTALPHLERVTILVCARPQEPRDPPAIFGRYAPRVLPSNRPSQFNLLPGAGATLPGLEQSVGKENEVAHPALETICIFWRSDVLSWDVEDMATMLEQRAQARHPIRRLVLGRPWDVDEEWGADAWYYEDVVRGRLEGYVEECVEVGVTMELDVADPSSAPGLAWVAELPAVCRDPEEIHKYWPRWV